MSAEKDFQAPLRNPDGPPFVVTRFFLEGSPLFLAKRFRVFPNSVQRFPT